ncbi:hypothetical protein HHK36_032933 [Tetracentron sinense]|uniref:mitogen-activated protein kinase kinase kinase n=1 Tax=Tetracentron sinense TaxID=13715 RepID=A0A834Y7B0_TETSI|nr:hypothetical protein HHK36_032933 [Tetracentron sinense]
MPSWWGKSSSKEVKKKVNRESFIETLHRKFKSPSEEKCDSRLGGSRRHCSDIVSEKGSRSRAVSPSPSPSTRVSRCQSFAESSLAQPLPLPGVHPASIGRTNSGIYVDGDLATASISSDSSIDSDDPADSRHLSSHATDSENGSRTAANSPTSMMHKDQFPIVTRKNSREALTPANHLFSNQILSTSPKRRPLSTYVPNLQIPHHSAFCSAPDSSISSPSRSPMRAFGPEQVTASAFWAGKPYPDVALLGSGHCSSPGSGPNSGHNSMGGDMSGQLFWQPSRGSPECSPIPSPRMTSPDSSSRIHSGAVTPMHPRAGGAATELPTSWPDDGKQQSHRLPLPPLTISNSSPFSSTNSAATSSSVPRSPGRAETPTSPGSRWKKGRMLGRGTFGHVYVGFNSESGEMCAMKEVTLFSDDAKSKESAKQLGQEISLLSRLRHQNIVQYYGSETVDDKLYIYLEYVSGGSIYKLLQDYGQFGELVIRSYTQQILSGLAYLHAKNTVHRDIKGANILVDPNGRVKLADFGMAKHITGQSGPLSFKGSPYWMAPEVIKNSNGCNLAVDIWSLGCTVLEMATSKPPWSQYEGVYKLCMVAVIICFPVYSVKFVDASQCNVTLMPAVGYGFKAMYSAEYSSNFIILTSSDGHISRNISCPVSPIGSPLLQSRSPQHMTGGTSPSPISSPRTTSGPSTPLTGGSGAIPFHHPNNSAYLHEAFGSMPRSPNNLYANGSTYHDPKPDLFRGMQPGSHIFRELTSSGNDLLGQQFGRPAHGDPRELYGQSVLADRVSEQLSRDHLKSNPSLGICPGSPMLGRTNGI